MHIASSSKAIVVNLEQIRYIITAEEVLILNSLDSYVLHYVMELQKRLPPTGGEEFRSSDNSDLSWRRGNRSFDNGFGGSSPDYFPFEFRALEVALESACTFLDSQAAELEIEAFSLLDELTPKISTLNLECQLMDNDGDMVEMSLTELKRMMELSLIGYRSTDVASISAPVSPVFSPPDSRRLEKSLSISRIRHESMRSSESNTETYFVVIDSTLKKLTSLKEYIDDTEDFINVQLPKVEKKLNFVVVIYRYTLKADWETIRQGLGTLIHRRAEVIPLAADRAITWCLDKEEKSFLIKVKWIEDINRSIAKMENWTPKVH
ncbi:hypothetical protein UlMin_016140 [Ulmus minor]